jgi:hypothetical protein
MAGRRGEVEATTATGERALGSALSGAGLVVVKEDKLSGEELEEAGIDVDDGGSGEPSSAFHILVRR